MPSWSTPCSKKSRKEPLSQEKVFQPRCLCSLDVVILCPARLPFIRLFGQTAVEPVPLVTRMSKGKATVG